MTSVAGHHPQIKNGPRWSGLFKPELLLLTHSAAAIVGGVGVGGSDIAISLLFRQTGTFNAPLFMLL